uniref:Uncharacterized protein n=1 Tax=Romanomermis culicivorax TaxID=13658 RepID=A0A915K5Y1_ROMCU
MIDMCQATVNQGRFNLKGCASDPITSIDPEVHVYHQCQGGGQTKSLQLVVPKAAIGKTYTFDQVIDLNDGGSFGQEKNVVNFPAMSEKCRETAASIE